MPVFSHLNRIARLQCSGFIISLLVSANLFALPHRTDTAGSWEALTPLDNQGFTTESTTRAGNTFYWLNHHPDQQEEEWVSLTNIDTATALDGPADSAFLSPGDKDTDPAMLTRGVPSAEWDWLNCCTGELDIERIEGKRPMDVTLDIYAGIGNWFFMTGAIRNPAQLTLAGRNTGKTTVTVINLPATLLLVAAGATGFAIKRRKARRSA